MLPSIKRSLPFGSAAFLHLDAGSRGELAHSLANLRRFKADEL
jgi:hypothetical protein